MEDDLSQTAKVDRVPENAGGLLRRVEAHGILRHNKVNHELALSLVRAGRS